MRITPRDSKLVDFKDSAMLTGEELNKAIDQVFYTQQELDETVIASFTEYGEMIESKVIEATAHAINAEASEVAAKASEVAAKASEVAAKASEDNALVSKTNAKASEVAAKASEVAAKASEVAAKASEVAAKASEDNALVSKTNAKASEVAAKASELAAKASEDNALIYANSVNPELLQHKAEKDQPGGYAGLDENGKVANAMQADKVGEKLAADVVIKSELNAPGDAPYFVCRAWVNFDGTTTSPTIRASGNVSSVVKIATSIFKINFTTPMPDINFCVQGTNRRNLAEISQADPRYLRTISSFYVLSYNTSTGDNAVYSNNNVVVFR